MNNRRRLVGVVTGDKMQKTVVVEVSRTFRHRLYKKVVHSRSRFMAHDELGAKVGDTVQIVESRPTTDIRSGSTERNDWHKRGTIA